jgi:hypothetical protein
MTTQIHVTYKPDATGQAESELLRFSSPQAADKFLKSIQKNPDVQSAKKV